MSRVLILGMAMLTTPTFARTPIYAHKPGVTEAVMNQEEGACLADADKAKHDPTALFPYTQGALPQGQSGGGGLAGGLASGASAIMSGYKRFSLTIYDCMLSKGYTMRQVTDADWKVAKKLAPKERQERMFQWRSAPVPAHPAASRDRFD